MNGADLFITITDRGRCESFLSWYRSHGIPVVMAALGQGTATGEVLDTLGLEASEKAILFCMEARCRIQKTARAIARDLWLDVPGNGILLAVPVSSIGGTATREYLVQNWEKEAEQNKMEREMTHELIVVITNQGHMDQVMDAARAAGAGGGTAIHAKGTGTELAKKFFGVSIAAEKEMIFILARVEDKKAIMKAVMAQAGLDTQAQSLVFSLPVDTIAGLRQLDEN